jgi:excinuclease UvrABC nuclease subunit
MNDKVKWLTYEFTVCKPDASWNEVGGIYIFCGINSKKQWQPYYIGQAENFRNRFSSHEQWEKAVKLGATHIHAMTVLQEAMREKIEKELIQTWKPPLNVKHAG